MSCQWCNVETGVRPPGSNLGFHVPDEDHPSTNECFKALQALVENWRSVARNERFYRERAEEARRVLEEKLKLLDKASQGLCADQTALREAFENVKEALTTYDALLHALAELLDTPEPPPEAAIRQARDSLRAAGFTRSRDPVLQDAKHDDPGRGVGHGVCRHCGTTHASVCAWTL